MVYSLPVYPGGIHQACLPYPRYSLSGMPPIPTLFSLRHASPAVCTPGMPLLPYVHQACLPPYGVPLRHASHPTVYHSGMPLLPYTPRHASPAVHTQACLPLPTPVSLLGIPLPDTFLRGNPGFNENV